MLIRLAACLLLFAAAGAAWSQEAADSPAPQDNAPPVERRENRDAWRTRERRTDRRWSNWPNHGGRDEHRPGDRERRGPRFGPRQEHFAIDSGELVSGYVFLDGQYLPPPYCLHADGLGLRLNEQMLKLIATDEQADDWRRSQRAREWCYRLQNELLSGSVVTIESPLAVSPNDDAEADGAIHSIAIYPRGGTGAAILRQLTDRASSPADEKLLPKFLANYTPPADLVARATQDVDFLERSRTDAVADVSPLANWAYPLTVLGMFLAAVAVGQLFVSRSLLTRPKTDDSPDITRAAVGCILVVAGLSILDLIWTLLSVRAGIMHELNPLATQFLSSSLALTSFKIGITLCGATILYFCRYHRPAQLASWWLCMVCTLVTVRWVAFTSLFVT